jgi:hypothetical protein
MVTLSRLPFIAPELLPQSGPLGKGVDAQTLTSLLFQGTPVVALGVAGNDIYPCTRRVQGSGIQGERKGPQVSVLPASYAVCAQSG